MGRRAGTEVDDRANAATSKGRITRTWRRRPPSLRGPTFAWAATILFVTSSDLVLPPTASAHHAGVPNPSLPYAPVAIPYVLNG